MAELVPNLNDPRLRGQVQVQFAAGRPAGSQPRPTTQTVVDLRARPHPRHAHAAGHQEVRQGRRLRTDPRGVRVRRPRPSPGSTATATASSTARNSTCGGPARRPRGRRCRSRRRPSTASRSSITDASDLAARGFTVKQVETGPADRPHRPAADRVLGVRGGGQRTQTAGAEAAVPVPVPAGGRRKGPRRGEGPDRPERGPVPVHPHALRRRRRQRRRQDDAGRVRRATSTSRTRSATSRWPSRRPSRRRRCSSCSTRTATGGSACANCARRGTG